MQALTALVAVCDRDWCNVYQDTLEQKGCVVFTTSDGLEGMELMRDHQYDILVVDESLAGAGPVEFVLSARDLLNNSPVILVAGADVARFEKVWRRCNVYSAATRSDTARILAGAVTEASSRVNAEEVNEC